MLAALLLAQPPPKCLSSVIAIAKVAAERAYFISEDVGNSSNRAATGTSNAAAIWAAARIVGLRPEPRSMPEM